MADLNDVAHQMRQEAANEIDFSDPNVQEAYQQLSDEFSSGDREELVQIARGTHSEYNGPVEEAMRNYFRDKGVRETYLEAWDDDTLRGIQYGIKQAFKQVWNQNQDAIGDISKVFRDADISHLNKLCAKGEYGQVYDDLGEPDDLGIGRPDNFADCAELVASAKNLSETLGEMYEA